MFSPHLRESTESMTLLINEQCRRLQEEGRSVVRFGFGQSPFPPLPAAIEELRQQAPRKEYAHVQGLPELRSAIASFHTAVDRTKYTADDVFVGPGTKQLIFNLMMCFKQLNVYIPAPAWVSYEPQARIVGHPVVRVTSDPTTWRPTAALLDEALQTVPIADAPKLLIINNPGNPDGRSSNLKELQDIAGVCAKHGVLVLSDEIYGLLHHDGVHVCFATLYERCILLTGLSKWCGAGGWRIGAFLFPGEMDDLKTTFKGIASESYSCVATPVQAAAVKAYDVNPEFWRYIGAQRKFLKATGAWCAQQLRDAGIAVNDPHGAFYLFVDFTSLATSRWREENNVAASKQFFALMLERTGVAVLSGSAFGMPADHFCARLAYVTFDGARVLSAIAALGDGAVTETFIEEHAPLVVQGIRAMAGFAKTLRE
jgi:aspartate aminotransferase